MFGFWAALSSPAARPGVENSAPAAANQIEECIINRINAAPEFADRTEEATAHQCNRSFVPGRAKSLCKPRSDKMRAGGVPMAKSILRTGKKVRPKTAVRGKRFRCARCRKRSLKPL